jgi:hypothetical protein
MAGSVPRGWGWCHGNTPRVARRGCWASGQYTHTAHEHTDPLERVTIVNPIHPLHGRSLPVRQVRRVEHLLELIVEHPDGGVLTLPAWATDYEPRPPTLPDSRPLAFFHPALLVQLTRHVMAHLAGEHSSRPSALDMALPAQAGMPALSMTIAVQGNHDDPRPHPTIVATPSPVRRETPTRPAHRATRRADARTQRLNHRHHARGAI